MPIHAEVIEPQLHESLVQNAYRLVHRFEQTYREHESFSHLHLILKYTAQLRPEQDKDSLSYQLQQRDTENLYPSFLSYRYRHTPKSYLQRESLSSTKNRQRQLDEHDSLERYPWEVPHRNEQNLEKYQRTCPSPDR